MTPLPITCSLCGGQIEPDDVALRDEIVVCPFCSTVNRITPTGTEKSADPNRKRRRPDGVKIESKGGSQYLFKIKGSTVFIPLIVSRLIFFSLIGVFSVYSILFLSTALDSEGINIVLPPPVFVCYASFCFFWLPFAFLGVFREKFSYIPPIKLAEDTLFASEYTNFWGSRPRVSITDIRQIYTVVVK